MNTCHMCNGVKEESQTGKYCVVCEFYRELARLEMEDLGMQTPGETLTTGLAHCVMCDKLKEVEDDGVCHRCSELSILAIEQEMSHE